MLMILYWFLLLNCFVQADASSEVDDLVYEGLGAKRPVLPFPICSMNNNTCSLEELQGKNYAYYIRPGGRQPVKCLDGSEYQFQVMPGHNKKLLIVFQDGAGCPTQFSVRLNSCRVQPGMTAEGKGGIFTKNRNNPYHGFTIVHVLYCTGDLNAGNVTMNYKVRGRQVKHEGASAVSRVMDWIKGQEFDLEELVIHGSSAGSLAVHLYADYIMSMVKHQKATVVMDSFTSVLPTSESTMLYDFGLCNNTMVFQNFPKLASKCFAKQASVRSILEATMTKYPNVTFAAINSKQDAVQRFFYIKLSDNVMQTLFATTKVGFYSKVLARFAEFSSTFPNFKYYFVNGDMHLISTRYGFYYTYPNGVFKRNTMDQGVGMNLASWLKQLQDPKKRKNVLSQCVPGYAKKQEQGFNTCIGNSTFVNSNIVNAPSNQKPCATLLGIRNSIYGLSQVVRSGI